MRKAPTAEKTAAFVAHDLHDALRLAPADICRDMWALSQMVD